MHHRKSSFWRSLQAKTCYSKVAKLASQNLLYKSRLFICLILIAVPMHAIAGDWSTWRGPNQDGTSAEAGLISSWSTEGENLLWQAEFIGRSTPIVLNDRVYVIGRVGSDIMQQERIACFDAETGEMIWNYQFNVFHTTISFNRVGWASLAGDLETGNIYAHGVQGLFFCFDKDGNTLWSRSLTEEYGRISGYGGRVHTPIIAGDLVVVSYLNSGWGDQVATRHRYFAFDKRTGELIWISTPGGRPLDTTYSAPVVANINGQQLIIGGNADGGIYAMKQNTGEMVWGFKLSQRGINTSVIVSGTKVYATHSEENVDNTEMGRVVCIGAIGTGDVTKTHELWRYDAVNIGYASPTIHDGHLYVVDNSANIHAVNADTGELLWMHNIGKVGKGSPVWADGKIYVTEVNGVFAILQPGEDKCETLSSQEISRASDERHVEIYGSPAIANGRIYFTTEEHLYCIGGAK